MLTAANSSRQARAPIRSSPQARSEAPPLCSTAKPTSRPSITRLLCWSAPVGLVGSDALRRISRGMGAVPGGAGCDSGSLPPASSP